MAILAVFIGFSYLMRIINLVESDDIYNIFRPSFFSFLLFLMGTMYYDTNILHYLFLFEFFITLILNIKYPGNVVLYTIIVIILGAFTLGILDLLDAGGFGFEEGLVGAGAGEEGMFEEPASSGPENTESTAAEVGSDTGIDIDGDGEIEGFDTDGDGKVDQNIIGVEVPDMENVEGYTQDDGTKVDSYVRTEQDQTVLNNLEPKDDK